MDAILHQTADAEAYFPMLAATLPANRAFCLRHGIRLDAFIGIRRGCFPWHAAFNRLGFLRDRLAEGFRGWAIYLDADAFVADLRFDIAGYLRGHAGTAMIGPPGAGGGAWDVNSGIFLWNFAHEATRVAAARWVAAFDAIPDLALATAPNWDDVDNDQLLLHRVLQQDPALAAAVHMESDDLLGYQHSRFIKQFVRNAIHTPDQRLVRIARQVALTLRAGGIAPGVDPARVISAYELLAGAPPPTLEAAFDGLHAHDLEALAEQVRRATQA
jgi:hypothetical protein